jgi:hypothetical protein
MLTLTTLTLLALRWPRAFYLKETVHNANLKEIVFLPVTRFSNRPRGEEYGAPWNTHSPVAGSAGCVLMLSFVCGAAFSF